MRDDLLFSGIENHALYETAQKQGVQFLTDVSGEHDEFLLYPLETIRIIEERVLKKDH